MIFRRPDVRELVDRHLEAGDPTGWFEDVYAAAIPNLAALPWASPGPHPALQDWLTHHQIPPPGSRAVVVGCGVGDDAVEVARHGFAVTAFDISPTAVRWARRRFRRHAVDWRVDDVLDPNPELLGAFDLVVEVGNVAWLPGVVRDAAMAGIAGLVADGGVALVVAQTATHADVAESLRGPPWPQAPSEFATYRAGGLERVALEHAASDPDSPLPDSPLMDVRMTWRRPTGPAGLPVIVPARPPRRGDGPRPPR